MKRSARLVLESERSTPMPLLSIVVAAYNHEAYIDECLRAIIDSEELPLLELIVIDDGSTDQTLKIAMQTLVDRKADFRLYTKPNEGLTHSLDLGLNLAKGRFISFMASDDAYITQSLDKVVRVLDKSTDSIASILFQAEYAGDRIGPVYGSDIDNLFRLNPDDMVRQISINPRPMLLQSTVFNTGFLRIVSPWSDSLELDDWPTFLRVSKNASIMGKAFLYDKSITLTKYRVHSLGIHKNLERQLRACLEVANNVVDVSLRKESRQNIYIDRSLNYLARGDVLQFAKMVVLGFQQSPSPRAFLRLLTKLQSKVFRK